MTKFSIYKETIDLNWKLIRLISEIDRFDAAWQAIERREGQSLKELKSMATVNSVGASTRIEGSKLTDEEVRWQWTAKPITGDLALEKI